MKAIRENEPRAISLGYRAEHYKLLPLCCRRPLAGLAGSTKALVFQFASLTDVDWTMSGEVVLMTLLGGIGTILGPVVGALHPHDDGELPGADRLLGHDHRGRHLRHLRPDLPRGHRRGHRALHAMGRRARAERRPRQSGRRARRPKDCAGARNRRRACGLASCASAGLSCASARCAASPGCRTAAPRRAARRYSCFSR